MKPFLPLGLPATFHSPSGCPMRPSRKTGPFISKTPLSRTPRPSSADKPSGKRERTFLGSGCGQREWSRRIHQRARWTAQRQHSRTAQESLRSRGFSGFAIQRHTRPTAYQNDVYRSHGRGGEKACLSGDLCEYGRPEIKGGAGCVCPTNRDGCGTLPPPVSCRS